MCAESLTWLNSVNCSSWAFLVNMIDQCFFAVRSEFVRNASVDSCDILPSLRGACANDTRPDVLPPVDNLAVPSSWGIVIGWQLFSLFDTIHLADALNMNDEYSSVRCLLMTTKMLLLMMQSILREAHGAFWYGRTSVDVWREMNFAV